MAITSVGYGGTVDYPDYGKGVVTPARYSFDGATHFRPSRVTGGADRTVRVTGGTAQGWGIRDTEDSASVDVQLDAVGSGSRWDLIGLSRDWSAEETTLVTINGGSSEAIPSRDTDPGVKDVQPIALARVQAGQQYVTDVIDLRCWAADGGLVAVNTRALDYLDTPGTRVSIGSDLYTRILTPAGAASWDVKRPTPTGAGTVACHSTHWPGQSVQWRLDGDVVHLRAHIRKSATVATVGAQVTILTQWSLPANIRPPEDENDTGVMLVNAGASNMQARRFLVSVTTTGGMSVYVTTDSGALANTGYLDISMTWMRGA